MTEFIRYIKEREIGRHGKTHRTTVSDNITALRTSSAILAKTPLNSRSTYLLRLNNDSKLIAAAHANRTVAIYSASSGSLLGTCEGHERSPWTLAFHPSNSTLLASGCLGGSIRLWSLQRLIHSHEKCQEIASEPPRLAATRMWKQAGAIASLAFHPQHPILIVAWTQEVVFYDWVSGRTLSVWKFVSDHSRVRWVNLSPDGSLLYTATANPPDILTSSLRHHNSHSVVSSSTTSLVSLTPTVASSPPNEIGSVPSTHYKEEMPSLVSRHQLLNFLLRQPNSWFHERDICSACSLRLCKWAGTLGPFFPTTHLNSHQGLLAAQHAAILAAQVRHIEAVNLPFTVKKLAQSVRNGESKISIPYLRSDPNPTAVAVIEDLPAKEFLLSRGTYCKSGSPGVFARSGICCGGHACDLVLIHRELMRNSLCRPCLQSFWRWTNETVDWWTWAAEDNRNSHSPMGPSVGTPMSSTRCCGSPRTLSSAQTASPERSGPPVPNVSVGMCINCSIDVTDSSRGVCQPSSGNMSQTSLCVRSTQLSVVRAALSLIRKKMGNVHEVTRVTYLAPGIINDAKLSRKLSCMLQSSSCRSLMSTAKELNLPPTLVELLRSQFLAGKRELEVEEVLPKRSKYTMENALGDSDDASPASDKNRQPVDSSATVSTPPSSPCRSGTNLAAEAVHLATSLDVSRAAWNKPPPVRIVSASKTDTGNLHHTRPSIFDFVPLGSRLLHSAHEMPLGASASSSKSTSQTSSVATDAPRHSSNLGETMLDNPGMAACCKCGRIVPYTIPVGPKSSINEAICASLLFPAGYSLSTMESNAGRPQHQPSSPSLSSGNTSHGVGEQGPPVSRQTPPAETVSLPHGGVFSMLSQANSNSVLTSMQQGITNVMAGLLADMGDHASACSLQDTTYRICRWELQLCGPVQKVATDSSPPQHLTSAPISRPYLPMPLNVAVSYSRNSLVVPDVRIFNDSSICLSPDGHLLGAFVVPHGSSATSNSAGEGGNPTVDSLLAIFRLTPYRRRGQCIYARKFVNANPVCLDFSPNANMLAVGLAATGLYHSDDQIDDNRYRGSFESSRPSTPSSLTGSVSSGQNPVAWHSNNDINKKNAELPPVGKCTPRCHSSCYGCDHA
uniref:Uncharacterized protein n=1 Tax=Schistocephalus solidus TaxID=70667 RepID=A0A0X3NXJ5_SCHSO